MTAYKTFAEYFTDQSALSQTNNGITLTITGLKYDNANVEAEAVDAGGNPVAQGTQHVEVVGINVKDKPLKIIYSVSPTTGTSCAATGNEIRLSKNGRINPVIVTLADIKPYVKTKKLAEKTWDNKDDYYAYASEYVQNGNVSSSDGKLKGGNTYLTYTNTTLNETLMYRVKAEFVDADGNEPASLSVASKIKITPYYDSDRMGFSSYPTGSPATFNYAFADSYDLIDGASIIDDTPYAVYENGKLTFKCGNFTNESVTTKFGLNTGTDDPEWKDYASYITKVEFDETFALATPTSCYKWFNGCSSLSTIVGMENYLNVSSVKKMDYMFSGCSSIEVIDISGFQLSNNLTSETYMFSGCSNLTTILVGDGWRYSCLGTGDNMFAGCTSLIGEGGSKINPSFLGKAYADAASYGYLTKGKYKIFFDWNGDGIITTADNQTTKEYKDESLTLFENGDGLLSSHPSYTGANTHYYYKFAYWSGPGITGTNTTTITLSSTDKGNRIYTANWKLPYVEYNSSKQSLTFKYGMESEKEATTNTTYELNKPGYNPSWKNQYTYKSVVFDPSFAKAVPENCSQWFYGMSQLTSIEGLQYLYTNEVKDMTQMFYHCLNLTSLNLSNFNTAKVTSMSDMFNTCENLKTIRVGDGWKTDLVTSAYGRDGVFTGCNNLVGESGTKYKTAQVNDVSYARLDGGPESSTPGYLTYSKYPVDDLIVGQGAKVKLAVLDNIAGLTGTSTTAGIGLTQETNAATGVTSYYLTTTDNVAVNNDETPSYTLTIKEGDAIVANINVIVKDYTSDWYHEGWYKADDVTIAASNAAAPGYGVYVYTQDYEITNFDDVAELTSDETISAGEPKWVAYVLQNTDGDILTKVIRCVRLDNTAPQTVDLIAQNTTRSYPSSTWGNIFAEGTKLTIKCADSGEGDDESRTDVSGFGKFGFTFDATADFSNPADTKITWITNKDDFADAIDFGDLPEGEDTKTMTLRYIAYDVAGNATNLEEVEFTITKPNFEVSYGTKKLYFYHALDAFGIPSDATNGATITVTLLRDYTDNLPFGLMHIENYDPYDNSVPTVNYVFDFRGHTFKTTNGMGYKFIVKDGSMTFEGEDGDPADATKPKTELDAYFVVEVGTSATSMTINGGNYKSKQSWASPCVGFSVTDDSDAELTINGGTFQTESNNAALQVTYNNADVTVNGGTFIGYNEENPGVNCYAIYNSTGNPIISSGLSVIDNSVNPAAIYTEQYKSNQLATATDGTVLKNVTVGALFTATYTTSENKTETRNFSTLKDALTETNYTDASGDVTITQNFPYTYAFPQGVTDETLTLQTVNYVLNLDEITCTNHLVLDVKTNVTINSGVFDDVAITVKDDAGNLIINDGTFGASTHLPDNSVYLLYATKGKVTVNDGTITNSMTGTASAFLIQGGEHVIKGGSFISTNSALGVTEATVTINGGTFSGAQCGITYLSGVLSLAPAADKQIAISATGGATYSAITRYPGLGYNPFFTGNYGFFNASDNQIPEHYDTYGLLIDNGNNHITTVYVKSVATDNVKFKAEYADGDNTITRGFSTLDAAIAEAYPQSAKVTITPTETTYDNDNAPLTFQTNVEFTLDLGGCTVSKAMFQVKTDNNVTFKSGIYNSGENNNYALDITGGKVALASTTGKTTKFVGTKAAIHNEPATTLFDGLFGFYDDAATPQLILENYGGSESESITDKVLLGSNNTAVKTVTVGAVSAVCKVSYTYDDNGTTKTFAKEFATLNSALAFIHEITKNVAIKLEMLADHTVSESALYSGNLFGKSSASLDFDLGEHTLNLGGNKLTFKMDYYYGDGVTLHNGSVTSSNSTVVYTKKVDLTCADINIKSTSNATPDDPNNYLYVINKDETGCLMKSGTVIEAPAEKRILPFSEAQMELNYEMIDKNGKVMSPDGGIQTLCPNMVTYYLDVNYDVSKVTVQPAKYFKAEAVYSNGNTATKYFGRLVYAFIEDEYKDENGNYPTKVTVTQEKAFATEYRYGKDYLNSIEITHSDFDITLTSITKDSLWLKIQKNVKITGTNATNLAPHFYVTTGGSLEIKGGNYGSYAGACAQCEFRDDEVNTFSAVMYMDNDGTLTITSGTFDGNRKYWIQVPSSQTTAANVNISGGSFSNGRLMIFSSKANISGGNFVSEDGSTLYVTNSADVKLSGGTFKYSGSHSETSAIFNGHTQPHSILEDGYQMYDNTGEPIDEVYGNGARGLIIYETDQVVTEVTVGPRRYTFVLPAGFTAYDESDNEITYATEGQKVTLKYSGTKYVKEIGIVNRPGSITITNTSPVELSRGASVKLNCTISPDPTTVTMADEDQVVTWSSDDNSVAEVESDGTVTAGQSAGEAIITAKTKNGVMAKIKVKVE